MKFIKYILPLAFVGICGASEGVSELGLDPTLDIAHEWEWADEQWWDDPENQIEYESPWSEDTYFSNSNIDYSSKEDGWVLYKRNMFRYDTRDYSSLTRDEINVVPKGMTKEAVGAPVNYPYFVLYNKFTGILRFFVYNVNPQVTYNSMLSELSVNNASFIDNNHGMLLTAKNHVPSLIQDYKEQTNPLVLNTTYTGGVSRPKSISSNKLSNDKWFVADYMIDYDPQMYTDYNGKIMTFELETTYKQTSNISIDGTMISKENIPEQGGSFFNGILGNLAKGILDNYVPIVGGMAFQAVAEKIEQLEFDGQCFDDGSYDDFQNALLNSEDVVTKKLGSLDLVSKITRYSGLEGSAGVNVVFDTSAINLEGKIVTTSNQPLEASVAIIGTKYKNDIEVPYLAKSEEVTKLGVYNFNLLPKVTIYYMEGSSDYYFSVNDFSDCDNLLINPESGNELVEFKIKPILDIGGLVITETDGKIKWVSVDEYRWDYSSSDFKAPDSFKKVKVNGGASYVPLFKNAQVKAYMKFKYTDISGNIKYNEFMNTYGSEIVLKEIQNESQIPDNTLSCNEDPVIALSKINVALDNNSQVFHSFGEFEKINVSGSHDGDALVIKDDDMIGPRNISMYVEGPGYISFNWKHDVNQPTFLFYVDRGNHTTYSGSGWQEEKIYIEDGTHELKWYMMNTQQYLDNIQWRPINIVPTIITPLLLN